MAVGTALAICALASAAAGAGAVQGSSSAASATPAASSLLAGVNIDSVGRGSTPAQATSVVADARTLHAKVIRIEIPWAVFEPLSPAPERIEAGPLAYTDRLLASAGAAGIRVILDVDDTPCWASSAPSSLLANCRPLRQSGAPTRGRPSDPAAYATFVVVPCRVATRRRCRSLKYGTSRISPTKRISRARTKPQRYAAVLRAAYTAVKAVDPNIPVLAGSLVASNGKFLRELYAAGIKGYYDGLAVHLLQPDARLAALDP